MVIELSWLNFLVRYGFCYLMATCYSGILRWCKESSEPYIFVYKWWRTCNKALLF